MSSLQALSKGDYAAIGRAVGNALVAIQGLLGFSRSAVQTDSIAAGATVGAIKDLGANYGFLLIRFTNCVNVQANTKVIVDVGVASDNADTLCRVFDTNLQSSNLATLPTGSGNTLQVPVPAALGAKRVRVTLSVTPSGGPCAFEIYGVDRMGT